nr:unnamed protein product [Spirometra erinaceieuropaei]
MWAHRVNATAGIFWHNPAETWVDVKSGKMSDSSGLLSKLPRLFSRSESEPNVRTRWMSESGVIDIFVMLADSPSSALSAYASLTGTTRLPPLFALGYHQCRWNYNDEQDVSTVNANFDVNNLPMDVMWLDIEYSDGKRYLKWDATKFSDPDGMLANLTANDRKLVVVVDPHIKRDSNWDTFRDAESKGFYVKTPDSGDFDGWCWPGSSSWPDFLRPEVQNWWADLFLSSTFLRENSMFYVWNDMNEPSVFSGSEITMPKAYKGGKSISLPVDLGSIPVFHRGGFIVPKKARIRRSSGLMAHDPYTLVISLDPELSNNATGYLYFDDFHSVDVSTSARFYRIDYRAQSAADPAGSLTLTRLPPPGSKQVAVQPGEMGEPVPTIERLLFVGFNVQPRRVTVISRGGKESRDLEFTYLPPKSTDGHLDGQGTGLVVVRKPDLPVSEGWTVSLRTDMVMSDEL